MEKIEINDPYTGEWTTFIETNKTYNGDAIIDAYCDDILYKKAGNVYYRRVLEDSRVDIRWFGALPDRITDCSDAIQKAFISADKFKLSVTAGKGTYLVTKTIYIPQNHTYSMLSKTYDFNESVFLLNSDITVFESGYYDVNGMLVSVIGTDLDYRHSVGVKFRNFSFETTLDNIVSPALIIKDWHQGCEISNISSDKFSTLLKSINNYYTVFNDLRSIHQEVIGERFIFSGELNLNVFRALVAGNALVGYKFDGPLRACHFDAISVEGVTTGIQFNSEVNNCSIVNSYIEGFETAFEFKSYINNFTIDNNYINFVSRPVAKLIRYVGLPINNIHLLPTNTFVGMLGYNQLFANIENDYGYGIEIGLNTSYGSSINGLLMNDFGANYNIEGKVRFPTYLANVQNAKGLISGNYSGQYTRGYDGASGFEIDSSLPNLLHLKTKIKHTWTQIVYVNVEVSVSSGTKYYKGFFIGSIFYELGNSGISVSGGLASIVNSDSTIDIKGGSYENENIMSVKGEVRLI